jgi:hypothetical protein
MKQMNNAIWQQLLPLLPPNAIGCHPAEILPTDLGLGALGYIALVLRVECHFGIEFSVAELEELRTGQDLLSGLERHLQLPLDANPLS